MRQKIISLSLDTYELASKKANFSAWVRKKLLDEQQIITKKEESRPLYQAHCEDCDKFFQHYQDFMMQTKYCNYCHTKCAYLGLIEDE